MTITSASRRWFGEVVKREDSMGLMIVCLSPFPLRIGLMTSKLSTMRMFPPSHVPCHCPYPIKMRKWGRKLISRTLLKLNAYYAFPALSNGEPQEPYTATCLNATRAIVALIAKGREIGWVGSSSPLFIWSCWVAARVLFGMSPPSLPFPCFPSPVLSRSIEVLISNDQGLVT